jgi:putative flippase GtrA
MPTKFKAELKAKRVSMLDQIDPLKRDLLGFLLVAIFGASLDFGVFLLLVQSGADALVANLTSSSLAIFFVYNLSIKFLYKKNYIRSELIKFFCWYVFSIVIFSLLIKFLIDFIEINNSVAKIIVMPISFAANFVAGRALLNA